MNPPEPEHIHQCQVCKASVLFGDTTLGASLETICLKCAAEESPTTNRNTSSVQAETTNQG